MKARAMHRLATVIFLTAVLAAVASPPGRVLAQDLVRKSHCEWERPARSSSAIDHYEIEMRKIVGELILDTRTYDDIDGTSFDVDLEYGYTYQFRVRAIDVNGDKSPWSVWSNFYAPDSKLIEHVE